MLLPSSKLGEKHENWDIGHILSTAMNIDDWLTDWLDDCEYKYPLLNTYYTSK